MHALLCCVFLLMLHVGHAIELINVRRTTGPAPDRPVEISWGTNETHIEVQLSYPTQGWLAMGLSPEGGMDQSDVLFGYVDDLTNEVIVQDRYLQANLLKMSVNLSLDEQQDWQKIAGSKNGTYTVIRAVRLLKTCDKADHPFRDALQHVIYSLHTKPPTTPTAHITKHTFKYSTNINFVGASSTAEGDRTPDGKSALQLDGAGSKKLQFTIGNVSITGDLDTVYYCAVQKVPTLDKKYHAIATQPLLDKENLPYIHHMLVYSCNDIPKDEPELIKGKFPCSPTDGSTFMMKYCPNLLGAWAMGQADVNPYPKETGQPWGPEMSGKYVLVQLHYNNPERRSFVDNSGMIYHLSDQLRQYDMGTLMTGLLGLDFTMTLPPGQKVFTVQGQCVNNCTELFPKEGITIFSSVIHMHTRGLSGVVRHFRGSKELPLIDANLKYDFNLQATRPVMPFRKFLPGDRIVVECNFTTENDIQPVFGGEGSMEEMCLAFLNYYPKSALKVCGTRFRVPDYLALMSQPRPNQSAFRPKLTPEMANILMSGTSDLMPARRLMVKHLQPQAQKYFSSRTWSEADVKPLQDFFTKGANYLGICNVQGILTPIPNDNPPVFEPMGCKRHRYMRIRAL
ncbi:DBH-like monooxygenase protein 1 homolog [Paramacrobiotus metropolitanus]|uniref:DBH-like monooxygenase protein 1 homolog n=1 Tax=Paramacrobiotus metropolitanus TaxID=2943436 RepID=UPI0024459B09|nr:DBH-like monooxygenase protein 1 homolog [Paramacrobiotus metropolitanus]